MCQALYELMEDEIKEKEERAKECGKEETLLSLVRDGLLDATETAKRLSITMEELEAKLV